MCVFMWDTFSWNKHCQMILIYRKLFYVHLQSTISIHLQEMLLSNCLWDKQSHLPALMSLVIVTTSRHRRRHHLKKGSQTSSLRPVKANQRQALRKLLYIQEWHFVTYLKNVMCAPTTVDISWLTSLKPREYIASNVTWELDLASGLVVFGLANKTVLKLFLLRIGCVLSLRQRKAQVSGKDWPTIRDKWQRTFLPGAARLISSTIRQVKALQLVLILSY